MALSMSSVHRTASGPLPRLRLELDLELSNANRGSPPRRGTPRQHSKIKLGKCPTWESRGVASVGQEHDWSGPPSLISALVAETAN